MSTTTTASCSYMLDTVYPAGPRYLARNSTSHMSHKRSGVLKTTSPLDMIAKQRSNALLQSVSEGDVSLDAILAFPIDWQGIASELQWTRSHMATIPEDDEDAADLGTMNPLAIKMRTRPAQRRQDRHALWASASARTSMSSTESFRRTTITSPPRDISPILTLSPSSLGLDIGIQHSSPSSSSFDDMELDNPSTPELYSDSFDSSSSSSLSSSSSSASDSPVSTPKQMPAVFLTLPPIEDASFDLKSYCSAFNEPEIC